MRRRRQSDHGQKPGGGFRWPVADTLRHPWHSGPRWTAGNGRDENSSAEGDLVGRSRAFRRMLELVARVAPTSTPVLLLGEPGTGKRTVARALHRMSRRSRNPFVILACAEAAEGLFEGVCPPGGCTLYLDGVEDLRAEDQGELLRRLSEPPRERDPRFVFAARPDLPERVEEGKFSPDLYFRISLFPIRVPALRERPGDLGLLAARMLKKIEPRMSVDPRTLEELEKYPFPGNLDELRSALEHACLESESWSILPCHLPARRL